MGHFYGRGTLALLMGSKIFMAKDQISGRFSDQESPLLLLLLLWPSFPSIEMDLSLLLSPSVNTQIPVDGLPFIYYL